jgi:hypothetical protein
MWWTWGVCILTVTSFLKTRRMAWTFCSKTCLGEIKYEHVDWKSLIMSIVRLTWIVLTNFNIRHTVCVYLYDLMLAAVAVKLRTVISRWVKHVSCTQYPGKQYTVDISLICKSYCHKFVPYEGIDLGLSSPPATCWVRALSLASLTSSPFFSPLPDLA